MEQIVNNLENPSWWFTGLFFILIGILLTKLFFNWIPNIWRKTSEFLPKFAGQFNRWSKRKSLQTIKNYRQHDLKVHWLISRYWSLATTMTTYGVFVTIMFALSPSEDIENKLRNLSLFIPLYLMSFIVIREKKLTQRVINANIKWKKYGH